MKKNIISALFLFIILFETKVLSAPAALFGTSLISDISEKVSPAVVAIESVQYLKARRFMGSGDPFFDRFFAHLFDDDFSGYNNVIPQKGSGSGVLISADGYLLTNEHVISDADEIIVKFENGKNYKAKIIGKDKETDLAVLKIESKEKLTYVELGDSDKTRVGEWVIAIGNPFGLGITVTAGVVSAVKRDLSIDKNNNYKDLIQTDASINPGNSGGALINSNGELIGVNTAIIPSGQGIGFAIPVNRAKRIVGDLIKYGKVKKVDIGLTVQTITAELAEYFNIQNKGVLVSYVETESSASKAGIVPSDVIIKIGNKQVNNVEDFNSAIENTSIGEKLVFQIIRKGKISNIIVAVSENFKFKNVLGLDVRNIDKEVIKKYNLYVDDGVVVAAVANDSPCKRIGLKSGDVILQIDDTKINNKNTFLEVIKNIKSGERIFIAIVRGSTLAKVLVRIP